MNGSGGGGGCDGNGEHWNTKDEVDIRQDRRRRDNEKVRYIFFEKTNNNHVGTIFNFVLWRTRAPCTHTHTTKRQYFEFYFLSFFFGSFSPPHSLTPFALSILPHPQRSFARYSRVRSLAHRSPPIHGIYCIFEIVKIVKKCKSLPQNEVNVICAWCALSDTLFSFFFFLSFGSVFFFSFSPHLLCRLKLQSLHFATHTHIHARTHSFDTSFASRISHSCHVRCCRCLNAANIFPLRIFKSKLLID